MSSLLKKYQYFGKTGIEWTEWFEPMSKQKETWQIHNKLKNEYKTSEK